MFLDNGEIMSLTEKINICNGKQIVCRYKS